MESAARTTSARKRSVLLATIGVLALAVGSGLATASGTGGISCPGKAEQPFVKWADPANYVLVADGALERTPAWTLSKGVKVGTGNEPWKVRAAYDASSLTIPGGGSATTGPVCAGLGDPTLRLFATGSSGQLRVDVLYRTALGETATTVATLGAASWAPTLPLPFLANVLGLTSPDGLTTTVRFRFTVVGKGTWQVDDVYVDPWKVD